MPLDSVSWNDKPEPDGLRRLRRLETVIENVRDDAFELRGYLYPCGTIGCALGHAGLDVEMRREGFACYPLGLPQYADHRGYEAGEHFFGLSYAAAQSLFNPEAYGLSMFVLHDRRNAERPAIKAEFLRRLRSVISEKAEAHARETVL